MWFENLGTLNDDIRDFIKICESIKKEAMITHETHIEITNRPTCINYNKKALINMTEIEVPMDIEIALSFGWKFLFPYTQNNSNLHITMALIEDCIENTLNPILYHEAFTRVINTLNNSKSIIHDENIKWLNFICKRTGAFLQGNPNIMATRSDKGGHTVIINKNQYTDVIEDMINDKNTYHEISISESPLKQLIEREKKFIKILRTNYKSREIIVNHTYEDNIKTHAKFYGLPKVHKEKFALRPIVSMINAPGHLIGKIFNTMLKECFPISEHHIKDSYHLKAIVDELQIDRGDELISFDVVSMYTNIPRSLVEELIMNRSELFLNKFGMGKKILHGMLKFLLEQTVMFTANGKLFIQIRGLPMGGCISTTLARIVMDRVMDHLLSKIQDITFIKIYVDDTIAAMKPDNMNRALEILNSFDPEIKFTMEREKGGAINFLNLTLIRDGNKIITNWYRKPFASGRLVNFYSNHTRSIVMNTAYAFIDTVLKLSDPRFFHTNKEKVINTLRDNSFPETKIIILMNNRYTYMKNNNKKIGENSKTKYCTFPNGIEKAKEIKKIIYDLKDKNTNLINTSKNTKVNHVSTMKTKTDMDMKSNMIAMTECVCRQYKRLTHTKFNENCAMVKERMKNASSGCGQSEHAWRDIKWSRGLALKRQTRQLIKYKKQIMGRGTKTDQADLPNQWFKGLVNKRKTDKYIYRDKL